MSQKRYIVKLSEEERAYLEGLLKKGKHPAAMLTKVRILLKADASNPAGGCTDASICEALSLQKNRPEEIRKLFVEEGLERVKEARLIALACSEPPTGRARWTLQLLADTLVELKIVDAVSDDTVRLALKKMNLSLI